MPVVCASSSNNNNKTIEDLSAQTSQHLQLATCAAQTATTQISLLHDNSSSSKDRTVTLRVVLTQHLNRQQHIQASCLPTPPTANSLSSRPLVFPLHPISPSTNQRMTMITITLRTSSSNNSDPHHHSHTNKTTPCTVMVTSILTSKATIKPPRKISSPLLLLLLLLPLPPLLPPPLSSFATESTNQEEKEAELEQQVKYPVLNFSRWRILICATITIISILISREWEVEWEVEGWGDCCSVIRIRNFFSSFARDRERVRVRDRDRDAMKWRRLPRRV